MKHCEPLCSSAKESMLCGCWMSHCQRQQPIHGNAPTHTHTHTHAQFDQEALSPGQLKSTHTHAHTHSLTRKPSLSRSGEECTHTHTHLTRKPSLSQVESTAEGEAQRYFDHALTLRNTILFLRYNKELSFDQAPDLPNNGKLSRPLPSLTPPGTRLDGDCGQPVM